MATTPLYCINHPNVETLLRCNRCGKPYCTRCLVRTPVGYRCKTCLNIQQAGFFTATPVDYGIVGIVGIFASIIGGGIATAISGFWLFEIFYAPAAGGAISEAIWRAIRKRRGRYLWAIACIAFILGSVLGAMLLPIVTTLMSGRGLLLALARAPGALINLGFLIYLALAIGTVYARLR